MLVALVKQCSVCQGLNGRLCHVCDAAVWWCFYTSVLYECECVLFSWKNIRKIKPVVKKNVTFPTNTETFIFDGNVVFYRLAVQNIYIYTLVYCRTKINRNNKSCLMWKELLESNKDSTVWINTNLWPKPGLFSFALNIKTHLYSSPFSCYSPKAHFIQKKINLLPNDNLYSLYVDLILIFFWKKTLSLSLFSEPQPFLITISPLE